MPITAAIAVQRIPILFPLAENGLRSPRRAVRNKNADDEQQRRADGRAEVRLQREIEDNSNQKTKRCPDDGEFHFKRPIARGWTSVGKGP
jgi:hypothetical protein